jgi:hypothetical protein
MPQPSITEVTIEKKFATVIFVCNFECVLLFVTLAHNAGLYITVLQDEEARQNMGRNQG